MAGPPIRRRLRRRLLAPRALSRLTCTPGYCAAPGNGGVQAGAICAASALQPFRLTVRTDYVVGSASGDEAQRPVVISVVIWPDRCARICGGFHIIARAPAGPALRVSARRGGARWLARPAHCHRRRRARAGTRRFRRPDRSGVRTACGGGGAAGAGGRGCPAAAAHLRSAGAPGHCLEALAAHGGLAGFTPPMTVGCDMPLEPALNASGSPGGGLAPRSRESRYVIRAGLTRMCVRDEKSG